MEKDLFTTGGSGGAGAGRPKRERFVPPEPADVAAYFEAHGSNGTEARRFWNFYGSKNWMIGKNKMSVWRLAASNWIADRHGNGSGSGKFSRADESVQQKADRAKAALAEFERRNP